MHILNNHNANNYVITIIHSNHTLGMICAGSPFRDHYEILEYPLPAALHIFISGRYQKVPLSGTNYILAYYTASDHEDEWYMRLRYHSKQYT